MTFLTDSSALYGTNSVQALSVYLSVHLLPHLIFQSLGMLLVLYDFLLKRNQLLHLGLVELVLLSRFALQLLNLLLILLAKNEQIHFQVSFSHVKHTLIDYLLLSGQ